MITRDALDVLAVAAHNTIRPNHLTDISSIPIDTGQPLSERIEQFLAAVDNPYIVKTRDTVVRVSYTDDGPSLSQLLEAVAHIDSS